jgi:uncharacterized caspase-like protein
MRRLQVLILALCWILPVWTAAEAEVRVALVIGNSAYQTTTPLANPLNDARDMAAALKATGFSVIEALDADKRKIDGALRAFADQLTKADVALFFYAGHGLQVGAQNYLVPIDAKLERERDLEFEAVKLEFILRQMEIDRDGKTTIVILDACRDNPLARNLARSMGTRSTSIGRGLAAAPAGLGTFIAYSTQPGNVALDGDGRNSPFTAALVKHMGQKGRNLPATMIEVRKDVVAATGGRQVPWDHSALTGDFYFQPGAVATQGTIASAPAGTSVDVAALQERLRALEEDAKRREATGKVAPPPQVAAVPPVTQKRVVPKESPDFQQADNVRIDGLKLSQTRQPSAIACREACQAEQGCVAFQHGRRSPVMGQCELFARVDARHEDASWRSGVRAGSGIASEQSAPSGPLALPSSLRGGPTRRDKGFDIYDGQSVMGEQIKMSAADSAAGCQVVCRNTPGCVVATYNDFFKGKNVACQVYREITGTMKTPSSTLMVRVE